MPTPPAIRHRADGSIDIAFYMQRGRVARAEQAKGVFRSFWIRRSVPAAR